MKRNPTDHQLITYHFGFVSLQYRCDFHVIGPCSSDLLVFIFGTKNASANLRNLEMRGERGHVEKGSTFESQQPLRNSEEKHPKNHQFSKQYMLIPQCANDNSVLHNLKCR